MGSSQEAKDLENYSKSSEGASIKEIGKSTFEQNIYICGNYDINIFINNLIQTLENPYKSGISNYEKMAKHKEIDEWHFFFSPKISDLEKIKDNIVTFLEDHNDDDDYDDFKENSKTRIGKTTIVYFNDKNIDSIIDYFLKEHNPYFMPFIIFIGSEEENKELHNKILKGIKDLKKNIDPHTFKYCIFNKDVDNFLINLNMNLIECAAFYNELGDEFKFPKNFMDDKLMENDLNEILQNFATFNILICGRPGVGKSTFINNMIKAMICKASVGEECSSKIVKYIHRSLPITFYDTPGISTEQRMKDIIDLIKKKISN